MGEADRLTRVNELLKREIADNLEKCLLFSGGGALVSVTEVKTSVDLRNATVFISIFVPKNGSKHDIWNEILEKRIEIQRNIAKNLKFKHTPVIAFKLDERLEEGDRVLQLLNEMEENSESEEVYEETAESYTEESVETKTFDNELVKFMSDNYPQLNFPSSCPIKNEVTMTNGNRLTLVSLKNLGHKNFWVYIYYFNRDIISNPNNVPIGAKIKIPDLSSSITNPDSEVCMKAASDVNQKLINK